MLWVLKVIPYEMWLYIFKLCFKMNHTLVLKKLEVSKDNRNLPG